MIFELDITIGDIRRAIGNLPDSNKLKFQYGEAETESIFARVDGITAHYDENDRHDGALLTVSLIDEEAADDDDDDEEDDDDDDD